MNKIDEKSRMNTMTMILSIQMTLLNIRVFKIRIENNVLMVYDSK